MPVRWNGAAIFAKAVEASKVGVDKTMAECVNEAKTNHPYQNQTGTAEGSVRIVDPARFDGRKVFGRWGSVDVAYFIFLEMGTRYMDALPSLRPAADTFYPRLNAHIREAFAA